MVEPETDNNLLKFNDNSLVVTKAYSVKWKKDEVDLVELAKKHWIDEMSLREIAQSMEITRGQVAWNLKKIKANYSKNEISKLLNSNKEQ